MLVLNEEERMLADSASELLQSISPISVQRKLRDDKVTLGYEQEIWQQMVEMGWSAIVFDEQYDGLNFSYKGLTSVFEQMGANLSAAPLLSSVVLCGSLIEQVANDDNKTVLLPAILSGEIRYALALDEGRHHAPHKIATTARKTADGYVLSGTKSYVIDGLLADKFIVLAQLQSSETTDVANNQLQAFIVPSDAPGLSSQALELIDSRNYAVLQLDNVNVSEDALVNAQPISQETLDQVLDIARSCLCAELLGACETMFKHTVEYLKTRVQFDAPIGSFQALQHRAAWLFTELELSRSCVLNAAVTIDEVKAGKASTQDLAKVVSLAMYKVSVMTDKITSEAIQLHGGIAVTDELDLGFFLKRARVAQALLGDRDYHQRRYAHLVIN